MIGTIQTVLNQMVWPCVREAIDWVESVVYAPVAQLDRVSASEAEGHRFESCRARHLFVLFR